MIGILLVTHGGLGREFLSILEHIVSPQEKIKAISINDGDNVEQSRAEIIEAAHTLDTGEGVIILTDMFGGTPSNLAMSVLPHANVEVVAGVNLPMLIKLTVVRDTQDLHTAALAIQEAAKKYITVASALLEAS